MGSRESRPRSQSEGKIVAGELRSQTRRRSPWPAPRMSRLPMEDWNDLLIGSPSRPETWERPWSAEVPFRAVPDRLYEYACHEGNYSMTNVLRGARAEEQNSVR